MKDKKSVSIKTCKLGFGNDPYKGKYGYVTKIKLLLN